MCVCLFYFLAIPWRWWLSRWRRLPWSCKPTCWL